MKRRSRLSRSRDFDAVYRHGRSVSSRYLVLYSFPRPVAEPGAEATPRLGLAVSRKVGGAVERNLLKRRLREAFELLGTEIGPARDYVLIGRPGLVEATEARGFEWLVDCVREIFGQARALEGASR
jgi:ribonuclease P protein component